MRFIPGGTFLMGSSDSINFPDAYPAHTVTVSSFYMDTTEVTQAAYQALMQDNPSTFVDPKRPVDRAMWSSAIRYCNARSQSEGLDTVYTFTGFLYCQAGEGCYGVTGLNADLTKNGYRLPTEAEWEYACRARSTSSFYWNANYPPLSLNDTLALNDNAVWQMNAPYLPDSSSQQTSAVASKKPNAFGLYDMAGNVWEWCNDLYDAAYYRISPQVNPAGPISGSGRVCRGGSWADNDTYLTSAARSSNALDYINIFGKGWVGFRCVRRSI
jgi:formylglycine-generating enzyme required for sulfatase activity